MKKYTREAYGLQSMVDDGKPKPGGDSPWWLVLVGLVLALAFYWWVAGLVRDRCAEDGGQFVNVGGSVGCIYPAAKAPK